MKLIKDKVFKLNEDGTKETLDVSVIKALKRTDKHDLFICYVCDYCGRKIYNYLVGGCDPECKCSGKK